MKPTNIILVSGAINSGKTTKIKSLIATYKRANLSMTGFYSEKVFVAKALVGYDLILLSSNEKIPFLRINSFGTIDRIGPYFINKNAFSFTNKELLSAKSSIVIMDEIGRLELSNKGFSTLLTHLLATFNGKLILAVRDVFLDEVISHWQIQHPTIIKT
jgi:nucleoside-triphosphatase THEP1